MVTIREIKAIGQSGKPIAARSPYYRVLRNVSPYFTKFFIELNVSANQITFCSIILGIAANFTFIFGNHNLMLLGCFIYQFWHILDIVDGEIARVTNVKTAGGKYLEDLHYIITECGFVACLGIGLSRILNSDILILWGLTFALFICLHNAFVHSRNVVLEQFEKGKRESITINRASFVKRVYKRARLFFVIFTAHLVLAAIVIIELILLIKLPFPMKLDSEPFGESLTILSIYFFLYGFIWIVRTIVSSVRNYRTLMKD